MKWIETPNAYLVHSHCNGSDGTNLGWVAELVDNGKVTYQAWLCNGHNGATELGSHYKTPRLAQQVIARELLKRWFTYKWVNIDDIEILYKLYVNGRVKYLCEYWLKSETLARAKREFLSEL